MIRLSKLIPTFGIPVTGSLVAGLGGYYGNLKPSLNFQPQDKALQEKGGTIKLGLGQAGKLEVKLDTGDYLLEVSCDGTRMRKGNSCLARGSGFKVDRIIKKDESK